MILSDELKVVFGVLALIWFGIQVMAKRRPDIAWLQQLRIPEVSPERQARNARRHEILSGMQFILLGVVLPLGYGAITVMTFNDFDLLPTAIVALTSVACIGLGIFALTRNRT